MMHLLNPPLSACGLWELPFFPYNAKAVLLSGCQESSRTQEGQGGGTRLLGAKARANSNSLASRGRQLPSVAVT